jgi:ketosteroid isomerase-like protein
MRIIVAALVFAGLLGAETKAEILALDQAWRKAILAKDAAALDKMLADDLVYGHATGIVDTKATYIAKVKSGKQLYQTLEQKKVTVNLYGASALTHSWMHVTGINQDGKFDDKVMLIHVWVKQNGTWRLAGHQTTKVATIPD